MKSLKFVEKFVKYKSMLKVLKGVEGKLKTLWKIKASDDPQ